MVALAEVLDGTDSDWFVGATTRQSGVEQAGPGFTGYITDNETGLLHARARQYSPTLGRFVGRDMIRKSDRRLGAAGTDPRRGHANIGQAHILDTTRLGLPSRP